MKQGKVDIILTACVTLLLMSGLIMVFSASSMVANSTFGSLTYFFRKQILWGSIAFGLMIVFSRINYKKLKSAKVPVILILLTIALLAGLFVAGTTIKGATRWYHLGIMNFQPSEMSKLALILYLAYFLSTRGEKLKDFKTGFLPLVLVLMTILTLIMLQPDLSTSLMIAVVSGSMIFLSRARLRHIFGLMLPLIPLALFVMSTKKYQIVRITEWLQAWNNPLNAGYQIRQSLIGLGRGGWFGQGLGEGKQKFFFLPDSHTDFIFSIIGEEFGFFGTTLILLIFMVILFRGLKIATKASDSFGKFLAIGITLNIVLFAFINAGVVSMLLPATGLPMPFISYGGSNLLFIGISVGILLNISRHAGRISGATDNWREIQERKSQLLKTVISSG